MIGILKKMAFSTPGHTTPSGVFWFYGQLSCSHRPVTSCVFGILVCTLVHWRPTHFLCHHQIYYNAQLHLDSHIAWMPKTAFCSPLHQHLFNSTFFELEPHLRDHLSIYATPLFNSFRAPKAFCSIVTSFYKWGNWSSNTSKVTKQINGKATNGTQDAQTPLW